MFEIQSANKVLIVDDSPLNVVLLREVLKKAHPEYEIISTNSGKEALELIKANIPDIILLDVVMPELDGFEVCSILKRDNKYKHIPILLITALDQTSDKIKGFDLGAADYIVKPINAEETIARVESHLSIKLYHDQLKAMNEQLKVAQSALVESAKMSAVGSLSAGISHEFNNVLTMMDGHVKLSKKSDDISTLKETIDIVDELIQRSKQIINGLLSFSRGDKNDKMLLVDIREVIDNDLLLMKKMLSDGKVHISKEYHDVDKILCHPNQLSQVFVNIIKNAIEALQCCTNREIKIVIEEVPIGSIVDEARNRIENVIYKIDKCLVIKIIDNGPGINEKIKDKIFEPFVTSKGVLHGGDSTVPGTGLGLSIAFGIIKRHNGSLNIESVIDGGTTFSMTFPVIK